MTSLHPFPEIHEDLMAVGDILLSLPREAGALVEDILSGAIPGGKRIRPSVVLLASRMLGGPRRSLVEIAAAIEMIHIGTLVHDDIIDSVPRRRGHDSLHTLWGVSPAVLAGDFLLSAGLGRVASLGNPGLVSVLTDAVCSVCRGEIRELANIGRTGTKREEYFRVVGEKTASLFSAGMVMAGMVSGAGNETLYALENSGRLLGTAFQLVDDIADITGDERVTGKVPGTDLRRGIVTLPVIIFAEMQATAASPNRYARATRTRTQSGISAGRSVHQVRSRNARKQRERSRWRPGNCLHHSPITVTGKHLTGWHRRLWGPPSTVNNFFFRERGCSPDF